VADLTPYLVRSDVTAREAFDRLIDGRLSLLVVVDTDDRVIGTITDSSVRRAALADPSLAMPVAQLMSKRPIVAPPDAADGAIGELLTAHRLRTLPVVDDGRLVAVRSLDEFPALAPAPPTAVLMVGGEGRRLRPFTDKVPKPLLKIGAQSIVERIITNLAGAGVRRVYLAINHMGDQFEERIGDGSELGVEVDYLRETEFMGSAGALSLLPEIPAGPVFVSNGDLVTTLEYATLFDYHWRHGGAITITGVQHHTYIPYGVLRTAEHHVLGIDEKPQRTDFVSAGMYVLEPEVLRFVPSGRASTMPDLVDETIAEGLPVHVFPVLETWHDIGTPEEFERVLLAFATGEEE
jgi:dTDP-glucose pyrophosphorylase